MVAVSEFRVVPNGLHPLLLSMDREQVDRTMGQEPKVSGSRLPNEEALRYEAAHAQIVMRDGRAVEVSLWPPANVFALGKPLFTDPTVWKELVAADGDAREYLGFIVLRRLGLTLTGFHDGDSSQLAITAFEGGRWDGLESQMRPFSA